MANDDDDRAQSFIFSSKRGEYCKGGKNTRARDAREDPQERLDGIPGGERRNCSHRAGTPN